MFAVQSQQGYLIGYVRTTDGRKPVFDRSKRQAEVFPSRKAAAEGVAEVQECVEQPVGGVRVVKVS